MWCFDLANNLKALDSWKDDSAIISLALSPSCDKLAVGTSKVSGLHVKILQFAQNHQLKSILIIISSIRFSIERFIQFYFGGSVSS